MKISCSQSRPESAFTMVEISLCLAIVAFALVAIMGVLPSGLNVQRDNREDTIISQDAAFIAQCLRSGGTNLQDLSTNVEVVEVTAYPFGGSSYTTYYSNLPPQMVISLMTLPTRPPGSPDGVVGATNYSVRMKIRSLSGPIGDRGGSQAARDFAFRYILHPEVTPYTTYFRPETTFPYYPSNSAPAGTFLTPDEIMRSNNWVQARQREYNLFDIKLNFEWPVFPDVQPMGRTGIGRQSYRTMISGALAMHDTNLASIFPAPGPVEYLRFLPRSFTNAYPNSYP